ncbi:MAG: hypothetical protein ACP5P3_04490 [Ignavibacteria bacterium]
MFYTISEWAQSFYFSESGYEWLQTLRNKPRLIFLGPSTAKLGLSCFVVGNVMGFSSGEVVNLATDAQTPILSYYIFSKYNQYFHRKYIVGYILEPWVCSEYYYYKDGVLSARWGLAQRLFFISCSKDYLRIFLGGNFALAFKKIFRNHTEINYNVPPNFGSDVIPQGIKVTNFKEPIEEWFRKDGFGISRYQLEYLEKLKTAVENSGNMFVLILLPKVEEWTSDYEIKLKDYDDHLISELNTRLRGITVVGSFKLVPKDLTSDMFADNVHLNSYGQEFVSREIARRLRDTHFNKEAIKNLYEY